MVSPHFLDRDENFAIRRVPRYWDPTYAINNISKQTSFSSHVWRVEDSVGIRTAKSGEPDGYYIYTPDKQFSTGPFLQWQLEEIFQWRLSPDIYSRGYPHESNTLEHPVPPKSPASVVSTLPNGVYNRYCDFIIITIPKSFNPKWSLRLTDSRVFDGGDGVVWEPHMGVRLQYVNNDDKSGKYEMVDLDMKYVSEELTEKQVNEIFGIHISG
jgi:hypothetical protein